MINAAWTVSAESRAEFPEKVVDLVTGGRVKGSDVLQVLEQAVRFRHLPPVIRTDQGREFTGRALQRRVDERGLLKSNSRASCAGPRPA